jgi:tetratricopeptide (TPR) repeat protein
MSAGTGPGDQVVVGDPPVALTAADGAALSLRSLTIRAVVDEPLAFTELEMTFDNPEGRQLDGRLRVEVPPGARVTRFARAAGPGDAWHEAEVVPRRAAVAALRGEPSAPQAPALAAGGAGEPFVARVDAIAAREPTRVIVAYVQELRGRGEAYRLPLAGLPTLGELSLKLTSRTPISLSGDGPVQRAAVHGAVAGARSVTARLLDYRPARDLVLHSSGPRELGLRRDDMVVARISPVPHDHPDPLDGLTVLFDTSASQALDFDAHVDRLGAVLAAIDRRVADDIPLRVLAFDQSVDVVFEGRLGEFGPAALAALRARGALGASNLAGALRVAAHHGETRYARVLLMTDGNVTAGSTNPAALRAEAARMLDAGVVRVDVLADAGGEGPAARALLRDLSAVSPNHPGLVLHGGTSPDAVALRMTRGVVHDVEVSVDGSDWVYPQRIDAIQAGDDVLIYAGLEHGAPTSDSFAVHLTGGEAPRDYPVPLVATRSPLLQDAWSGARSSWLLEQARAHCTGDDRSLCEQWRQRAVEWATARRVVNDLTALVMLPSAPDYLRFGLDQAALGEVLAVGERGLEWRPREAAGGQPLAAVAAHAVRPGLTAGPLWDVPRAPASPTEAVRQDSQRRHAARATPRRPVRPPRAVREDMSEAPAPDPAEVPDKDAGAPRVGPRRTPDDAYEGNFLTVMNLLSQWGAKRNALEVAERWRRAQPGDVMALVALGEALEANGQLDQAARAYGSIIDLYPARADMRRLAAGRLERLGEAQLWLVLDSYGRAVEQRYDDPAGHRLFAYALLRAGYYKEAFEALVEGLAWARAEPRTRPLESVLEGDLGLVAAAWIRRWPDQEEYVREALRVQDAPLATAPSLRFVLSWDGDTPDLDLHVRDGLGWHAFYRSKQLASGGRLSDDMDAGYGLEAFVIDGPAGTFPYRLEVGYYARGAPHGAGKLEIVEHDGHGQLFFDERPFVVLKQRAYVDLGLVTAPPSQTSRR